MTTKITTPRLAPTNSAGIGSLNESDRVNNLLDRSMPSYRQAYSDRTAWLMACLSELAYIRFNPLFSNDNHKEWFRDHVSRLVDDNRKKSLDVLIDLVGYDHEAERKRLESALGDLRFQLSETFDCGGTQAILVSNDKFLVLAFRGTEATSVKDIKADARAKKTAVRNRRRHSYGLAGRQDCDQQGRVARQQLCRTALADDQIRGSLPARLP